MLSGPSCFEYRSNAGSDVAKIFRQASDAFPVVRFVLNAIEPGENGSHGSRSANMGSEPGDAIEPNRRRVFAQMGQGDFHAVGKARECDFQLRMSRAQVFESFRASGNDGGLQSSGSVALKAPGVSEITSHASCGGSQTGVAINVQAKCLGFSGHGWWPERCRRLPGNRGNNRDHRSKGERLLVPCRWCSTFHRRSGLPASHIAHRVSDLA
jgi:hypothetical protein